MIFFGSRNFSKNLDSRIGCKNEFNYNNEITTRNGHAASVEVKGLSVIHSTILVVELGQTLIVLVGVITP